MSHRSLCGAAALLLAACSRTPPSSPSPADAPTVARTSAATAASVRVAPPPSSSSASEPAPAIRPRPQPCLPNDPYAAPSVLAEEGEQALSDGDTDRALACAQEALRIAPQLVSAMAIRGDALAAQDRIDEARIAFARALAVNPDDPRALYGAADLYVRRVGSSADALEAGLEYARRGARRALAAPHPDSELAGRLDLLAGVAANRLGRNGEALGYLSAAEKVLPGDHDVLAERGRAYFDLCRLEDARRAFERALESDPKDGTVVHELALVLERQGEKHRADQLFAKARKLQPDDFPAELPVDAKAFKAEVDAAIASLPPEERQALKLAPLELQDLPDDADLLAVNPPLSPSILAMFRGPSEDEPCLASDGPVCRSIVLYRRNLLRMVRSREELSQQVRVTLLHELGHLHGESDDELRDRGLE